MVGFTCHIDWIEDVLDLDWSSHGRCSGKKGVLKNFSNFTVKQLCQSFFFNKVAGLRPVTLFKKRLWHRCFSVNFVKFLRAPFLQNNSGRLLLAWKCLQNHKSFFFQRYTFIFLDTVLPLRLWLISLLDANHMLFKNSFWLSK